MKDPTPHPDGRPVGRKRGASFVGTAEYCSPELLNDKITSTKSDVWALGCVLFQLLSGRHPFRGSSEYQTFQKVLHLEYVLPSDFPALAAQILRRVLVLDPEQRLDLKQVREHEFYKGVDWSSLYTSDPPSLEPWTRRRGTTNLSLLHGSEPSLSELELGEEEDSSDTGQSLGEENSSSNNSLNSLAGVTPLPKSLLNELLKGEVMIKYGIVKRVRIHKNNCRNK